MGWVPPKSPPRPPWMTDEQYHRMIGAEIKILDRMSADYLASLRPYVWASLIFLPVVFVIAVLLIFL